MTTMPRKTNDSAFDVGIFVFGNVGTPVIENMVDITDNVDSDRIVNIVATSTVVVIDGSVGNCFFFVSRKPGKAILVLFWFLGSLVDQFFIFV